MALTSFVLVQFYVDTTNYGALSYELDNITNQGYHMVNDNTAKDQTASEIKTYHNSLSANQTTLIMESINTIGSEDEPRVQLNDTFMEYNPELNDNDPNESIPIDVKYSNVPEEVRTIHYKLPYGGKSELDGTWLTMNDTFRSLYLYNIFWDNRQGLYSRPVLRVLGISTTGHAISREAAPRYHVSCYVTCEPGGSVFEIPHSASESVRIYEPQTVLQVTYERHVFACDLAGGPCEVPHRAVVMVSQHPNTSHPDQLNQTNSLPVEYPAQEGEVERIHVGVCGPLLYGTVDPYRLLEWLEMLKLLGVEKIVMHNHSMDQSTADIMKVYTDQGLVELRQVRQQGIVGFLAQNKYRDDIYAIGTILLTDCMYRNMFRFDWMAVLDLDELIIPRNHRNYSSLLSELDRHPKSQNRVGFKFLHVDFILDSVLDPQPAEGVPWQMAIPRHRRRFGVRPATFHTKSIIRPHLCTAMHYHICRGYIPNIRLAAAVSSENAIDCHYRSKLCPGKVRIYKQCLGALNYGKPLVDNIALPFKSGLQKAMNPQLRLLGLESIT